MPIVSILILVILTSCASSQQIFKIENENLDALRHESLYRYDQKRLSKLAANNFLALCHQSNFLEAQKIAIKQLDQRKNEPVYWTELGTCYYLQKEDAKAKFYYQMALGLSKSKELRSSIINNIGLIYLRNSKYDEAKEHFKQASIIHPNSLTPHYNLAQVYLYFGHYKNAKKQLERLYHKNPKDIDFIYLLGHISLMKYQYKKAKSYFDQIPIQYLKRQDMANSIAMLYIKMGQFRKADIALHRGDRKGPLKTLNAYVELEKIISNNYDKDFIKESR
jgi:tetratricopeptide (TPR) repeat protein